MTNESHELEGEKEQWVVKRGTRASGKLNAPYQRMHYNARLMGLHDLSFTALNYSV